MIEVSFTNLLWMFLGSLGGMFAGAVATYLDMRNNKGS